LTCMRSRIEWEKAAHQFGLLCWSRNS